jgi:hypothetical protein
VPGIGTRDKDPTDGVTGAVPERSAAHLVEAGILTEQRGQDGSHHEVFDRAVGKCRDVALAIAGRSLPEARFAVFSLADAGEQAVPRNLHVIELASHLRFEFLSRGKRRYLADILQREKVR